MTSVDIARLPRKTLKAGTTLYRIHRAHLGPWLFAESDHGRFNPTGTPGRGTCYWAEEPLGAWVESFRTVMTLASSDIALRALSAVTLDKDLIIRDLTVKRALAAGITVAVTGGADYQASQTLADDLQGVSDGVRYRVRHDLSASLIAIAWFGDAGPATGATLAALPTSTTTEIPEDLIDAASAQFGYRVLPQPV